MRRIQLNHSFHDIISLDNLLAAWREFKTGKRQRHDVQEFESRLMDNLISLHNDLAAKTYSHGGYEAFRISDPKPRHIHKATVRDRVDSKPIPTLPCQGGSLCQRVTAVTLPKCYNGVMLADYVRWQYVDGPRWLLRLVWNLELASAKFFSLDIMLKTLISPWHKDVMVFDGGTLTELFTVIMWNIVSRAIGFFIRSIVILIWLSLQTIFLPAAALVLLIFVLWPHLSLLLIVVGLALFVL